MSTSTTPLAADPSAPTHRPVALVTGAAQGVGTAIATRLAADGALVAVNDRVDTPGLRAVAGDLAGTPAPADVSDPVAVAAMVERIERDHGPVEVLVANAAVETMGDVLTQTEEEFWQQIHVNLTGTYHLIQAVLPGMRRLGHGRIIVLSSIWAITGYPRAAAYAASKAGLIGLTKSLAVEVAPEGILVNAIAPGCIDSPQIEVDAKDAGMTLEALKAHYAAQTAIKRVAQPEEIAGLISFLAGAGGSGYVGQVLQPNGGAQFGWA